LKIYHAVGLTSYLTGEVSICRFRRKSNNYRQLSLGPSAPEKHPPPANPHGNHFTTVVYNARPGAHDAGCFGETTMPQASQPQKKNKVMGDKSPKSNQKKSSQKQTKVNSVVAKKQAAAAAKSAVKKK
jgi:hypothetical protein